jgi:RNA polymerase sigma factor (sigma-70 family)
MNEPTPTVFVVEDDPSVRHLIHRLLESVRLKVKLFESAEELWPINRPVGPGCLVLDIRLPGISGLDLQGKLAQANIHLPIIFVTGHGDIPMSVEAMKAGAVDFLAKPFRNQDLLDAVRIALEKDRAARQRESEIGVLQERFNSLTERERSILEMVVSGMLNKQIASEIGITENTVKVHRSHALEKMQAKSLAELVTMVDRLRNSFSKAS